MKKNELILSAVAAVVMTGCGGGSSSTGTTATTSSVPTFATQEAEIKSTAAVEVTLNTLSALNSISAAPTSATKSIKHVSMKDKFMAANVDKNIKSVSELRTQKVKSKIKSVMAVAGCEPYTETMPETCTSGSAVYTYTIGEGTNPGECITTYSYTANSCVYEGEYMDELGDTYTWSGIENGQDVWAEVSIVDANGYWQWVGQSIDSAFTWKGTEIYTAANGYTESFSGAENINYMAVWEDEYTLTADGVFSYADKFVVDEKGTVAYNYSVDGANTFTAAYKADMSQSVDYSQANKYTSVMDGFIDVRYAFGTETEQRFSFAAEALTLTNDFSEYSASGIIKSTTDGKIGSQCTGGMVAFQTNRIITDNTFDAYELPNDGKMTLTGAAGSSATLEYQEDTTGTSAVATVGVETKTYNTYAEMQGEACQGAFLNPMEMGI